MTDLLAIPGLEKTSDSFRAALVDMAASLGVDPNFLTPVMANESGFNAQARNPMSNAIGLIQFMPSTARALGTSTEELASMTDEEQLPYVAAYLRPYAPRIASAGDAYMAVFMPRYVGSDPGLTIASSPAATYTQNRVFDREGKGYITVGDVERKAQNLYDRAAGLPPLASSGGNPIGGACALALLAYAVHRLLT